MEHETALPVAHEFFTNLTAEGNYSQRNDQTQQLPGKQNQSGYVQQKQNLKEFTYLLYFSKMEAGQRQVVNSFHSSVTMNSTTIVMYRQVGKSGLVTVIMTSTQPTCFEGLKIQSHTTLFQMKTTSMRKKLNSYIVQKDLQLVQVMYVEIPNAASNARDSLHEVTYHVFAFDIRLFNPSTT